MKTTPDFDDLPELINFRKINPNNYKNESPDLIREIRKSENRRENYLDLLFELDEPIRKFEVIENPTSKRKVVEHIRKKNWRYPLIIKKVGLKKMTPLIRTIITS